MAAAKIERVSLGFGNELDNLDLRSINQPHPKVKASPEAVRQAAEAAGFRSREPITEPPKPLQRRRRTGRNAQLNLKAKPETITAFTRLADAQGWGLGEAFEHAVSLLQREYDEVQSIDR